MIWMKSINRLIWNSNLLDVTINIKNEMNRHRRFIKYMKMQLCLIH